MSDELNKKIAEIIWDEIQTRIEIGSDIAESGNIIVEISEKCESRISDLYNHPTLTISRECPECKGSGMHTCHWYDDNPEVKTDCGVFVCDETCAEYMPCGSCTSGRQTRPLNMVEDVVEFFVFKHPYDDMEIQSWNINQTLKDSGWSIDESSL